MMVLFLLFFATASGVIVIAIDPGDDDVMHRPPRDPKVSIANRTSIMLWLLDAAALFVAASCRSSSVPTTRAPPTPPPR